MRKIKFQLDNFWLMLFAMLAFVVFLVVFFWNTIHIQHRYSQQLIAPSTVFPLVLLLIYLVRKYARQIKLFIDLAKMIWRKQI